jgi:hypothetical protein
MTGYGVSVRCFCSNDRCLLFSPMLTERLWFEIQSEIHQTIYWTIWFLPILGWGRREKWHRVVSDSHWKCRLLFPSIIFYLSSPIIWAKKHSWRSPDLSSACVHIRYLAGFAVPSRWPEWSIVFLVAFLPLFEINIVADPAFGKHDNTLFDWHLCKLNFSVWLPDMSAPFRRLSFQCVRRVDVLWQMSSHDFSNLEGRLMTLAPTAVDLQICWDRFR